MSKPNTLRLIAVLHKIWFVCVVGWRKKEGMKSERERERERERLSWCLVNKENGKFGKP